MPEAPYDAPPSAVARRARAQRRRRRGRVLLGALAALWLGTAYWQTHKPLPEGARLATPWSELPDGDVALFADLTTADAYGHALLTQTIFDESLRLIAGAHEFVVLDYFLFNDERGTSSGAASPRPLAHELADALIARKQAVPGLRVLLVTDPINEAYGAEPAPELARLKAAGIDVAVTELDHLRDSNFLYSSLWRLGIHWWSATDPAPGWLPNPLDIGPAELNFGAWAQLMNFKANQRRLLIADDGRGGIVGLVSSADPHSASSAHSNLALLLHGPVLSALLASEMAIARVSGWNGVLGAPLAGAAARPAPGGARVQLLTEGAIAEALAARIGSAGRGESIDIAACYLSDRAIIDALLAASRRGVAVRLILDPNREAYGQPKSGIPNRPVASELVTASDARIQVRWYRTHGEQFHPKLVMVYGRDSLWFILGSADLTRRDLDDYNLEASVAVETRRDSRLAQQLSGYFDTLWNNRAALGTEYTADVGVYADPSQLKYWAYRALEVSGLATF